MQRTRAKPFISSPAPLPPQPLLPGNNRIFRLNVNGTLDLIAGNGGGNFIRDSMENGPAPAAAIGSVRQLVYHSNGSIIFAERTSNFVWRVDLATNIITVFGGTGVATTSGDGGPATSAAIERPSATAIDADGNVYVAEFALSAAIRRIDPSGVVTTLVDDGACGQHGQHGQRGGNAAAGRRTEKGNAPLPIQM